MKYIGFCLGVLFVFILDSNSKNYYFSSSTGNDKHTATQAQNPATPWRSIEILNLSMDLFLPGDSILFKRGDLFTGQIQITSSGSTNKNIVFGDYGLGEPPILNGAKTISQWVHQGGNIWVADCPQLDSVVTDFNINGISQQMGRYPNGDAPNGGYLNIDSHTGSTSISSSSISSSINWTGGQAVLRTRRWILDWLPVASHQGSVLTFGESASFEFMDNFGFFIQDHISTLDIPGEWYYEETQKNMYLFSSLDPNLLLTSATAFPKVVIGYGVDYIILQNLEFRGAYDVNVSFTNSDHIKIVNCIISESGNDGVNFIRCNHVEFNNSKIIRTNNNALEVRESQNVVLKNNEIRSIALRPGMGSFSYHQYSGMFLEGDNIQCNMNVIDSVGYNGIFYLGDKILIKNNYIDHFCMTLEDGGGLYTNNKVKDLHSDRRLEDNIILNGVGATEGTDHPERSLAFGIFFDVESDHVVASGNTVAFCAGYGIFNHFANHISITGNTVYNNHKQIVFADRPQANLSHITNCTVTNNIFFSQNTSKGLAEFSETPANRISNFGTFDHNYYCRPGNDNQTIVVLSYNTSEVSNPDYVVKRLDLKAWQDEYGKDLNSSPSPFKLPKYSVIGLDDSNLLHNGTFEESALYWSCWATYDNCNMFWDNTKFDNGCLGLKVSIPSEREDGEIYGIGRFGEFMNNEDYLLKFSSFSSQPGKVLRVSMRNGNPPYNEVASEQYVKVNTTRQEHQLLFTTNSGETKGTINFIINEGETTYWMDNIELNRADVKVTQTSDSIIFIYNPESTIKSIHDNNHYMDAKGEKYHNFDLPPFSSLILLKTEDGISRVNSEYQKDLFLRVYPNPGKDMIHIHTSYQEQSILQILDLSGRITYEEESTSEYMSIDISSFRKGSYLVLLKGSRGIISSKLLVI